MPVIRKQPLFDFGKPNWFVKLLRALFIITRSDHHYSAFTKREVNTYKFVWFNPLTYAIIALALAFILIILVCRHIYEIGCELCSISYNVHEEYFINRG